MENFLHILKNSKSLIKSKEKNGVQIMHEFCQCFLLEVQFVEAPVPLGSREQHMQIKINSIPLAVSSGQTKKIAKNNACLDVLKQIFDMKDVFEAKVGETIFDINGKMNYCPLLSIKIDRSQKPVELKHKPPLLEVILSGINFFFLNTGFC